ncbi:actin filament-associated protein 1-like 1b isoform X2 [Esox lucius]|nr:actin filament-associated protein 1-like 1b isoform X2 [Esox lucius]XP_012990185.2 actin filament-associated protein 1-like 1b isoform X2 [Esox lucius]XP_012990186.2 actin filament-associated protein 1-like 1b isoform X2 [Esox lucius]XP_034149415.1 actin filament-associated protein 1-like 1b isoform X2 [Esox lucius]
MEHLVSELNVLLKLLDHESVSTATAEKMNVVRSLMEQLQPAVNGSDFIYVNTSLYGNGTSFVESLFEEFDLRDLRASPEELKDQAEEETSKTPPSKSPTDTPPPLPTTPPPEDYYEEAVPLDPGTAPQYITNVNTRISSSPQNSIEDAYYEDADNNYPTTQINGPLKNSYADSDALSSSYESYDEEDEEAKGQDRTGGRWRSEENAVGPVKDCRICAFLLRKKRFGQWAKQLTVVRDNRLQCYKSIKDGSPHIELPLNLCNVIYVPKEGRRKKHELRFSLPGGEALVLAVQSKEQAERWLAVIREVASQASSSDGLEGSSSPMIQRKIELDKLLGTDKHAVVFADKPTSDSDSVATGDNLSPGQLRDACEPGRGKRGAFSELTGSMSRAAGRKINRIISFSKKKPPLPGDTLSSSYHDDNPRCGYLNVLVGQCWKERWCCVRTGTLYLHKDRGDLLTHVKAVCLHAAEVVPGLGPKHPFAFRILQGGSEVAALEAGCSEEMGRWLGVLLAESGCATTPEALHYDYVDVDTITDITDAARHSFLWATSSSGASTDSRTYDEVPYESVLQPEEPVPRPGTQVKRHSSFSSSRDTEKVNSLVTIKRHGSNANQYVSGKYGKTRAEEDAKRYLKEKEEMEKEREVIRNALLVLRKERKEVKEQLKNATGKLQTQLETRLAQLEESCKGKEEERVDLELRLTEVKENLKKSLAGGVLGPPSESKPPARKPPISKPPRKAQASKGENLYSEASLPVNCAAEMRKRPASIYASSKGNVMQKAKEWESKKRT